MYRVAAYITAYQDVDAVKRCLIAIRAQSYPIEKIYIIDNSTLPISNQVDNHHKLIFDHHPENIGIAEGLNFAIAWSIRENYDFLWSFDQDSEPMPNALSSLIETYEKLTKKSINLGIVACLPVDQETRDKLHGLVFNCYKFVQVPQLKKQNNVYECDVVITSGSLMVVSAIKNIPRINENLFIDAVDWDLCLKFKQQGYRIYIDQNSTLNHHYGNSYKITIPILRRQLTLSNYSPLRYYYICRNQIFIETRYAATKKTLVFTTLYRFFNMIKKVIKIILFEKNQILLKIYATLKGTLHGFQGKL